MERFFFVPSMLFYTVCPLSIHDALLASVGGYSLLYCVGILGGELGCSISALELGEEILSFHSFIHSFFISFISLIHSSFQSIDRLVD